MNDTLIAVVTCKKAAHRVAASQATWIPQLQAAGYDVQIFDGERLSVPDDYLSLPHKTRALCNYAVQQGYKHMLKIDDDGYIRASLFQVIKSDYAGIRIRANDCGLPQMNITAFPKGTIKFDYASGGAYWLSELAMCFVVNAPPCDDWAEDRWVGQTLGRAGIALTPLRYSIPTLWDRGTGTWNPTMPPGWTLRCRDSAVVTQLPSTTEVYTLHSCTESNARPHGATKY